MKPDWTLISRDRGARNLVVLVAFVWSMVFAFFIFLAIRARMWSPYWAIRPSSPSVISWRRKP